MAFIGSVFAAPMCETASRAAGFPDLSLSLPILGNSSFANPKIIMGARGGTNDAGDVYDAFLQAQADTGLGGPTLPLTMRVPDRTGQGCIFGLVSG